MDNYVAEIRPFAFGFAPRGWTPCDGGTLPVFQNTALFSLLGTTYGGDGKTTFGLPDLRGAVVPGPGQGPGLSFYQQGESGGTPTVTLNTSQLPAHNHALVYVSSAGLQAAPAGQHPATAKVVQLYNTVQPPTTTLDPTNTLMLNGGGGPHNNMMPFLTFMFCIALQGIYPPRGYASQGVMHVVPTPGAEIEVRDAPPEGARLHEPTHVVMGQTEPASDEPSA